VHAHLKASVELASNRCLGKSGWQVEDVADDVPGRNCAVRETLPKGGFRQHMVTIDEANADKPAICNCLFFTCLEIPCNGIVAVVKRLGEDPFDVKWLPSQWRAASHPLATLAMQRVSGCVVQVHNHDVADDNGANDFESHALMSRVAKVAAIPYPTTERVRRSAMTEAFNSMRDTHHPYNHPVKYRAVMAALFDLGAGFNGTPGQWIQEQLPSTRFSSQTWSTNGDLLPPPANLANPESAKGKPRPGPPITVAAYNKKWKGGRCPTVDQLREAKGDWTLHRPAGKSAEWTCPLPGCTIRPIKNNDQSRYAHRSSRKHKDLLLVYPTEASIAGAVTLAIGIGIQNFPEGIAVSMPLRRMGMSRRKSFMYGQSSAIVEPIAGVLGALAVTFFTPILPYALAFAAGAMIFVVVEEVIPETQQDNHTDIATLGFIAGFIVMMSLDVALG
jgi:hypothetical protein